MSKFTDTDQTIEREGFTLRATIEADDSSDAPWDSCDGHGPVSDWRDKASKAPGERILHQDRGGSCRFYDFAEACRIAQRDGWDAKPYNTDKRETAKQQAAKAAEADFQWLRAWCTDEGSYVGVVVTASRAGVELATASLWGIESDAGDYLVEVANDLADEAIAEATAKIAELAQ